jgi:Sec-independent protein translocase protein TatA
MVPDIGLGELLVVAIVVLLVTKPEDLPVVMHRFGVVVAHLRAFVGGIWGGWQENMGMREVLRDVTPGKDKK